MPIAMEVVLALDLKKCILQFTLAHSPDRQSPVYLSYLLLGPCLGLSQTVWHLSLGLILSIYYHYPIQSNHNLNYSLYPVFGEIFQKVSINKKILKKIQKNTIRNLGIQGQTNKVPRNDKYPINGDLNMQEIKLLPSNSMKMLNDYF